MKKSNEILITNMEAEMDRLKWKDTDLATATGLTRSGIYKILKGQRWPSSDNLDRITSAFGRPPGWLLTDHSAVEPKAVTRSEAFIVVKEYLDKITSEPAADALVQRILDCSSEEQEEIAARLRMIEDRRNLQASSSVAKIAKK